MDVHGMKHGLKHDGKLARKAARKARPLLRTAGPIVMAIAAEGLPGAPAIRIARVVLKAIN